MKRIVTLALIVFALLRTGIVDLPERATHWLGDWSVAGASAQRLNEPAGERASNTAAEGTIVYRVPIREPDGAFLKKLLDLFDMNSGS